MLSSELPSKGNLMTTFIDKEIKAQRGQVTSSRSHRLEEGEAVLEPRCLCPRWQELATDRKCQG